MENGQSAGETAFKVDWAGLAPEVDFKRRARLDRRNGHPRWPDRNRGSFADRSSVCFRIIVCREDQGLHLFGERAGNLKLVGLIRVNKQ